ncbi:hypothetical protein L484_007409 [Morus notabilis]|uniref:TIR domain-containing protein n=1 Tax=Morus notabilis TaxID=981085 RepID=W9QM84_9ROSA|nr:hypothetical protein L484_007409 [Morus notabilis]
MKNVTRREWRAALTEVANIAGWDSRTYGTDSEFVEANVKDILLKLNGMSSSDDFKDLIGINKSIEEMYVTTVMH